MSNSDTMKSREEACLRLLRATKTDNEKLAALLLVPKLFSTSLDDNHETNVATGGVQHTSTTGDIQSSKPVIGKEFQRELIAAIDFQFLKRMLIGPSASDISEEKESNPLTNDVVSLKMAALSVVLCFTESEVLTQNQITQVVSAIESIVMLTMSSKGNNNQAGDGVGDSDETHEQLCSLCVECLENFARDQGNEVLETVLLPVMYRIVLQHTARANVGDQLTTLVSNILNSRGSHWIQANSRLAVTAMYLHQIKISDVGAIDFTMCEAASRLVYGLSNGNLPEKLHTLVIDVMGRMCDTLKNKLPSVQRQQALKLLTSLIQIRGIADLIKEKGSKAALLVIHLCSIDVRMTLEQDNNEKVVAESETLSAGFFALEQMIFYMAREERTLALDGKEVLQVHSALQGAVSAIIYFLTSCSSEQPLDHTLYGVVAACIRLLGAWTAEETQTLLSKYVKLLPDLIHLCKGMLSELDSFQFLIPGLSNLSTDTEEIVDVIVKELEFVCAYVTHCCSQLSDHREEYEHVLVNCCVVILNSLMMPDVSIQSAAVRQLLDTVAAEALKIVGICKNVDCNITVMVTGLAACRKLHEVGKEEKAEAQSSSSKEEKHADFYRQCVEYLLAISDSSKKARSGETVRSAEIPEIWLMGIQVLGDLMKLSPAIKDILIEEAHIRKALSLFDKHSSNVDAAFVLEKLLLTMADQAGAKDLIAKVNKAKRSVTA